MDKLPQHSAPDLASQIREPNLARLYEYWIRRKGCRLLPARRDIDPLDFGYLMGSIMLLDVLSDPVRFRCRLHGTALVTRAGYDLTGKLLDAMPAANYRSYVIERSMALVEGRAPVVIRHNRVLDGKYRGYEALWLPFADDGENVNMLLCALIYEDRHW